MRFAILVAASLFLMAGVAVAQVTENVRIVMTFWDRVSAGDVEAAMTLLAPNAEFGNPDSPTVGAERIRRDLESMVADGQTFTTSNLVDQGDGRVTYDYEIWKDGAVVLSGTDGVTIVWGGLIVFDGTEDNVPARFKGASA
jgi:hypothetical protein